MAEQEKEKQKKQIKRSVSSEKIKKLEEKNKALEEKVKELEDKYLRQVAEVENFKKRIGQERIQERKYAAGGFISDILNPYEQLAKIVEFPTDNDLLKNYLIGFKMIKDQFQSVLENEGVKEIKASDQAFDPKVHHAVEKIEDRDKPSGNVVEVLQKGYTYKERILRPAMVKVNEWSEENGEDK